MAKGIAACTCVVASLVAVVGMWWMFTLSGNAVSVEPEGPPMLLEELAGASAGGGGGGGGSSKKKKKR